MNRAARLQDEAERALAESRAALAHAEDSLAEIAAIETAATVETWLFGATTNMEEPLKNPFSAAPPAQQVAALREAEVQIAWQFSAAFKDMVALDATVGDDVLDLFLSDDGTGRDFGAPAERYRDLERRVDALKAAETAARERRVIAIRAVFATEAEVKREEARAKREEAKAIAAKTAKMLEALREHEGCDYAPSARQPGDRVVGGLGGGAPAIVTRIVPRSEYLQIEAAELDAEAARIAARKPVDSGAITLVTAEELWERLAELDPMVLGPTADDCLNFVREAERPALARLRSHGGPAMVDEHKELRYELVWRDGKVDVQRSRVYLWEPDFRKNPAGRDAQAARGAAQAIERGPMVVDPRDRPVRISDGRGEL